MITHVVFDWNGTLLADARLRYHLNQELIKSFGHPGLSFAEYQAIHQIPVHPFYDKLGISAEIIAERGKQANKRFHDSYETLATKCRTRGGTRETIAALHKKGITTIILSNHTASGIYEQLNRLKLDTVFDAVLANDDIHTVAKVGKKDRLVQYIKEQHLNPSAMSIIGDTEEETHIAKSLGMHSVAITGGTHSRKRLANVKPDAIISNLYDLIGVLEEL